MVSLLDKLVPVVPPSLTQAVPHGSAFHTQTSPHDSLFFTEQDLCHVAMVFTKSTVPHLVAVLLLLFPYNHVRNICDLSKFCINLSKTTKRYCALPIRLHLV